MNIFAAQFINSLFGGGTTGDLSGILGNANGNLPFATLLSKENAQQSGQPKTVVSTLISASSQAPENNDVKSEDLSSPDMLLSDLLAVNWQALQSGETIVLPNGWSISMGDGGLMTLSDQDGNTPFSQFTKEELQQILNSYQKLNEIAADSAIDKIFDHKQEKAAQNKTSQEPRNIEEKYKDNADQKSSVGASSTTDTITSGSMNMSEGIKNILSALSDNPLRPILLTSFYNGNVAQRASALPAPLLSSSNPTPIDADTGQAGKGILMISAATPTSVRLGGTALTSTEITTSTVTTTTVKSEFKLNDEAFFTFDNHIAEQSDDTALALPHILQQSGIKVVSDGHLSGTTPINTAQLTMILQKMATRGDTRVLTVQIDPPELGRVQVQLTSTNEKSLSAHILVEKPEAIGMLKRDLAQLEKSLHDAGLKLDSDGISFDLASDNGNGSAFAQQEFRELWNQNKNHASFNSGTELANDIVKVDASADTEEFYRSDTAVNIKV